MDQVQLPEQLNGRNVLVVPRASDVLALATAWFPDAAWARDPAVADQADRRPMTGARFRGMVAEASPAPALGLLALVPGTTLEGPVALERDEARAAGLGGRDVDLYALDGTDASALVFGWMSAAARRVGGSIVPADRTRVVTPDPGAAVDLTLWSPLALTARDALPIVRPAMTGGRVGPPTESADGALVVTATFEYDGAVTVRLSRSREIPVALSALDAGAYGPWAYRVTWEPPNPDELHSETPSALHLIARSRVQSSVARIAAALWRGADGTVVDSGGFVVTPDELREMAAAAR